MYIAWRWCSTSQMGALWIYFFRQITTFIKVRMAFVFGFQTLWLKDFSNIYWLKGLKPKNNSHTNFYECCDLMKKVYLMYILHTLTSCYKEWSSSRPTIQNREELSKNLLKYRENELFIDLRTQGCMLLLMCIVAL